MQSMPGQVIKQQYRARLCRAFQKMRADTYIGSAYPHQSIYCNETTFISLFVPYIVMQTIEWKRRLSTHVVVVCYLTWVRRCTAMC